VDPDKGYSRCGIDGGLVKVACCACDDASDQESNDDSGRLHDRRAKTLADDDGDEDTETETDELSATPGKRARCIDVGAQLKESSFGTRLAITRATSPVLKSSFDEMNTNEQYSWTGNQGREDLLKDTRTGEGHADFEQSAYSARTEDSSVAVRARESCAIRSSRAKSGRVHLAEGTGRHGNSRKRSSDDGNQAGSDIVGGLPDMEARDLNRGQDSANYERSGDEVALLFRT